MHAMQPLGPGESAGLPPKPDESERAQPYRGTTVRDARGRAAAARRAGQSEFGSLLLRVRPADADVLVDGEAWTRAARRGSVRHRADRGSAPDRSPQGRLPDLLHDRARAPRRDRQAERQSDVGWSDRGILISKTLHSLGRRFARRRIRRRSPYRRAARRSPGRSRAPDPLPDVAGRASRRVRLVEPLEDVRQVLGRNARAGVAPETVTNPSSFSTTSAASDSRAAIRRVTQRVGGQVLQRLLELLPVGLDRQVRRLHVDVERDRRVAQRRAVAIGDTAEQLADRHVFDRQRAAAALEPREIEKVADQRLQLLASRRR